MGNLWRKSSPKHHTGFKRYMIFSMMAMLLVNVFPTCFADASEAVTGSSASVDAAAANAAVVENLAAGLYSANAGRFSSTAGGFTWDTEGKSRSWTYYNGIMMDAYLMMDGGAYLSSVNAFFDNNLSNTLVKRQNTIYYDQANNITYGYVNNASASDNYYRPNELDSIPPVRVLFDLLRDQSGTVTAAQKSKYIKMIEYVYQIMQSSNWYVRNGNNQVVDVGGNFRHKYNNSGWATYQVALDGLYMAQPFFMELASALEDGLLSSSTALRTLDPAAIYNAASNRMIWIGNTLYDSSTGLYHHGWGPDAGRNGVYWLRAVGWYAAALADVISILPDSYSGQKAELIRIEKQLFAGMRSIQDPSGLWYNVLNQGVTTNSTTANLPETSGSALVAYAMMKSFSEGYVDEEDGEAGLKAFNGIVEGYVSNNTLRNVYRSAGVSTDPLAYLKTELYKSNEAKGVGPLMMAACYANAAAANLQKLDPEVTPPQARTITYNGMEQELVTAGSAVGGTMYYALGENADTAPVEAAGDFTDEELFLDDYPGPVTDGNEDFSDDGDDSVWKTAIPSSVHAGTYYVWYRVKGDPGYNDTQAACVVVTVTKASNSVTVSIDGWTYGDPANLPEAAADFGTPVFTYSDAEDGDFTSEVPGTSGTWYVKAEVAGTENYDGASEIADFLISRRALTITADAADKVYGEEDPAFTYISSGLADGDSISGSLIREEGEDAGEYDILQGTLSASDNYEITYTGAKLTIWKADAGFIEEPSANHVTYNGTAQELAAAGETNDGTLYYAAGADPDAAPEEGWSEEVPAAADAGTYWIWYKVVGDGNHTDLEPAVLEATIAGKSIGNAEVTLSETELFYTGSEQSVSVIAVTLDGIELTPSDYEASGTSGTDMGSYTVTVTGKGNYKDTAEAFWSIAAAVIVEPVMDAPDMVLPSSLTEIQSEAFMNIAASVISIPGNVTTIGERAFYGSSSLRQVFIPASVTSIGEDAFAECSSDLVVFGVTGSYAESWAADNGFVFE